MPAPDVLRIRVQGRLPAGSGSAIIASAAERRRPSESARSPRGLFESAEEYWATLWHGCAGHVTGHPKRLDRDSIKEATPFGSAIYSAEEILTEMAAAYMC